MKNITMSKDDIHEGSVIDRGRPRLNSGSDESLKWEEFFGGSVELAPTLMSMYDNMVASSGLVIEQKSNATELHCNQHSCKKRSGQKLRLKARGGGKSGDKKRPASISSNSSSGSSSVSSLNMDTKKVPYLTSIESFDDEFSDDDDEEENNTIRTSKNSKEGYKNNQLNMCNSISAPKPFANRPKYWDPNLSYIDRVVMEIIETEKTYVSDLLEIITGYMRPIISKSNSEISESHISDLFGNIEEIYEFNRNFLKGLEQCELNAVKVAQCFVEQNEGFAIYTNYCTNYPRTVSVLTEVMRKEESAAIFKERQACLEHTLPLGSYLLKPVQRILKYHLLLQNMVKHYEKGKEGSNDIEVALATMTGIASHINDMKRKHEHAVRVQEIQSLLYGWIGQDLTTYGELVAEGIFRVYGAKALRHVFLFNKILLIAKKKQDGTMSYKTHIMCSNLMLIESVPGEPLSFHVIPFDNPTIMFTLQARSVEQKREWSLQLKRVILENYNVVIPSHARQLVMELGQNRDEDSILADKSSSKKQHSAPEYLEKRKQERRKSETGLKTLRLKKGVKKLDIRSPKSSPGPVRNEKNIQDKAKKKESLASKSRKKGTIFSPDIDNLNQDNIILNRRKSESNCYSSRESLSHMPINGTQKLDSEDDCLSSSYLSEDNLGDYETLTFCKQKQNSNLVSSEDEDPSGEYITFGFAQKCLKRNPQFENPSAAQCYRYYSKLANYDNLAHVWSEMGVVSVEQLNLESEDVERKPSVRRVKSFNNTSAELSDKESNFQHTYSMRCGKKSAVKSHQDSVHGRVNSRPPSGIDYVGSPILPMVWLKKQDDHLSDVANKCGSLPRSFSSVQPGELDSSVRVRCDKQQESRPFTIASDKIEKSDFLDDLERYIKDTPQCQRRRSNKFPVSEEDCDDRRSLGAWTECSDTTSASNEVLNNDYKIYRHTNSRSSIRNILANVSSKLTAGLRNTLGGSSKLSTTNQTNSCSTISLQSFDETMTPSPPSSNRLSTYSNCSYQDDDNISVTSKTSTRSSAKLVYSIAKVYGNMLKHRLKKAAEASEKSETKNLVDRKSKPVEMYQRDSEAIGARFAKQSEPDYYSVPNKVESRKINKTNQLLPQSANVRPDSVLSESSNITSSSNDSENKSKPAFKTTLTEKSIQLKDVEDNTVSDDSYYERSFDAIENLLENDMFRDSAIYSDQDDSDQVSSQDLSPMKSSNYKPEVPSKPEILMNKSVQQTNEIICANKVKSNSILETLENLQKNQVFQKDNSPTASLDGIKSIVQRRKELEDWKQGTRIATDEQFISDEIEENSPGVVEADSVHTKGWVKHLVGKFQSDCQ